MENNETNTYAALPEPTAQPVNEKNRLWLYILIGVVVLGLIGTAIYFLLQPATPTDKIRDIFIIIMALESLLIGVVLIILVIQLATLINLLQHEIKPIIHSTNETVNTLRGTITFLSDNVSEPVIKMNEYLAGLKRLLDLLRPGKK